MSTKISENFTLEEFTNSATAYEKNISNVPGPQERENIIRLVKEVLQPIRTKYGKSITVSSGFRSKRLNAAVGGSSTSQHVTGEAADIKCNATSKAYLFNLILNMVKSGEIKVGQLIWEYGTKVEPQWIHVSLPYRKTNEILRAVKVNGRTQYLKY